ncbi:MAG TPA: GNAT family N-acetyltransferase [Candidatus Saccharimonadales bacterium]|nr:GNAT family N-acetyltransferase [Candidatus Saccharimonadales bacterium]
MSVTHFEIIPAASLENPELLRPVLESAIVDSATGESITEDIESILSSIPRSEEAMPGKYAAVAWSPESVKALGMMGLTTPGEVMRSFARTSNPVELINAYVLSAARGLRIGSALVSHLERKAADQGFTEIILNSGPRFRLSGWPFWRHTYGEPIGVARGYYGPHLDAPVWHKVLNKL